MEFNNPITVFMYHDVRDIEKSEFPKRYSLPSFLSVSEFNQHLTYIKSRYNVISLKQVLLASSDKLKLPKNPAVLTFDDGLADHYSNVFPSLKGNSITGVFFLPNKAIEENTMIESHKIQFILAAAPDEKTLIKKIYHALEQLRQKKCDLLDNETLWKKYSVSLWAKNSWSKEMIFTTRLLREGLNAKLRSLVINLLFREYVSNNEAEFSKKFYLTIEQVKEMQEGGMEIGGHGYESSNLANMSTQEQESDINKTHNFIYSHFLNKTSDPFFFSFPNGGYNGATLKILKMLGCQAAFTTKKQVITDFNSPLELPRFDGSQDIAIQSNL